MLSRFSNRSVSRPGWGIISGMRLAAILLSLYLILLLPLPALAADEGRATHQPSVSDCLLWYEVLAAEKWPTKFGAPGENIWDPPKPYHPELVRRAKAEGPVCRELAEQKVPAHLLALGWAYEEGKITGRPDKRAALELFRESAELGNSTAQSIWGSALLKGNDVLQDFGEGLRMIRGASEQGDRGAAFTLGDIYREGVVLKRNLIKAHMYYNVAASEGFTEAGRRRDEIAKDMTLDDVRAAQSMAREWALAHPEPE